MLILGEVAGMSAFHATCCETAAPDPVQAVPQLVRKRLVLTGADVRTG